MKLLRSINSITILYCLTIMPCIGHILMISKEDKLQLSTDLAQTWASYNIHSDPIDFFDAIYDTAYHKLYIAGYHTKKNCFVVLSSQDGASFSIELIDIPAHPIDLSTGDHIDFMKIRISSQLVNIFGRIYYKNKLPENTYQNFYLVRDKVPSPETPLFMVNSWRDERASMLRHKGSFTPQSTVIDITSYTMYSTKLKRDVEKDIIYFTDDPNMMGTYPFYSTGQGRAYTFTSEQGDFSKLPIPSVKQKPMSEHCNYKCNIWSTLHKNPINNSVFIFGGGHNEIFARKIQSSCYAYSIKNSSYKSFGATHFSRSYYPIQLFFVVKKANYQENEHPTAVLAYTKTSLSSTHFDLESAQYLDQSLLEGLTREQVISALEGNAFSRFIEEKDQHFFFLSYDDRRPSPLSLTLNSRDGKYWSLIAHHNLPRTVRTIITIPNHFLIRP